jgi:endonuclease-8
MPEGHTIHLFASDQNRALGKQRIAVTSPQGRFIQAKLVNGQILRQVRAYGKNLFYEFANEKIIHVHLGLHGKFTLTRRKNNELPEPRESVRMRMVSDRAVLDLVGPIRCEVIDQAPSVWC